ncbi:hypothetical protein M427DRAFT_371584 [Gonapodya prolifera JEL478]|uniref:Uncharacterized protein n=1 Tax=Gonapodya prolifera (strain JEL478) TaxID=1344416 RepID=A0A139A9K6_GONPJ|nr:hypothetical protein M427DRAFT_371584 [Gonapodya prolifera JEL478]|eukprot:KXS13427.1 hypothetical protein M427DRAFT_371584 [Gonapodya prolifera JEL478]
MYSQRLYIMLNNVGTQLLSFGVLSDASDEFRLPPAEIGSAENCPNLRSLSLAGFAMSVELNVLIYFAAALPHLAIFQLWKESSLWGTDIYPDMVGKLAFDAIVRGRKERLRIYFKWSSDGPYGQATDLDTLTVKTHAGCTPIGFFWE